ncbi:MAG TPA: ABC transporter ATP-binding protein [Bacteroidota bacterium]|nr:ABC transporter ATP-binding protein [Bacteroidota bacterium]
MSIIEIQSVSKKFVSRPRKEEIVAVNDVSLEIGKGEMFALVGPDGAGKTTLIRMLCGITVPSSGEIRVAGFDVKKQAEEVRKRIGYLSQRFSLYGDLTIDENIEFFAEIHGVYDYQNRRNELLEFTRLTPFRNRLAEKLSGGMKQKLALACTLIHTPEVILLDEPTTGVDPVSRRDFWKVLSSLLKTGITIIMSTPYLDEAERCSRVALMNNGKIMKMDTPINLKSSMNGEVVEIVCDHVRDGFLLLKNNPERLSREVQAFGDRLNVIVDDSSKDMLPIESLLRSNGITVEGWRVIPPSLENIFVSLLTHPEHAEGSL